ncbi:MAG: tRNA (adenosine(37)-N6)-threonylcarbamoyltransferase complex dimerization subunit type 1 TsaB [Candidatus Anammoximicrobium sp.]|nr:tRNA (adenosine(37)-N6)-threonylcarbamoyltransferase complex dimerization subunit type 1 TsaB [Candidatus Anammoximicrobium sp.]
MALRILALETSTLDASVAALDGDRLLGQTHLDRQRRTAQVFAPAIERQLRSVGWRPQDVQLVAVTQGPGSFTGLRVGITAAKTLAYAVGAEVFAVNTLKVIAWQAPSARQRVCAVLDAQRQQLFVADFRRTGEHLAEVSETRILDHADWLAGLTPEVAVTGPGLSGLEDRLPAGIAVVAPACWTPQAATVGRVACLEYLGGARHDLWTLNPRYYRSSAAEEKLGGKSVPDAAGAARKVTG